MKSKMKKGFTLTELVIVIAVIAILAAVLIPTYTTLVRKANISADTQLCKNMNTALATEQNVENMQQVVDILADAGYGVGKFNPTTENYRFVWDKDSNQILLLNEKMEVVSHAKDYNTESWELWLTIKNNKEVVTSKKVNFNYFLAYDYNGSIAISKMSSFATGNNTLNGNVSLTSDANGEATISGNIKGTLTVNTPNATVNQYGTVKNVDVKAVKANSFHLFGYAENVTVKKGRVVTENASYVKKLIVAGNEAKVENNSIIAKVEAGEGVTIDETNFDNTNGYVEENNEAITNPTSFTSQITNYEQLCAFRDAVNNHATYKNITVQLTNDIALKDGWVPIGNFARNDDVVSFSGTFDGNNKTISNLNNIGYSPKNVFQNNSTIEGKKEFVYGFFGIVTGATIKNVKLTNVNIDIPTGANVYGDKVGALLGHSFGNLNVYNVTVSGKVSAFDGVGGIVGGAYGQKGVESTIIISNCTNNAKVNGGEKAAGILGYTKANNVELINCINTGVITASATTRTPNNACYASGLAIYGSIGRLTLTDCESNGNVAVDYKIDNVHVNKDANGRTNVGVNLFAICNTNGKNYPENIVAKNNCLGTGVLTLNGTTIANV